MRSGKDPSRLVDAGEAVALLGAESQSVVGLRGCQNDRSRIVSTRPHQTIAEYLTSLIHDAVAAAASVTLSDMTGQPRLARPVASDRPGWPLAVAAKAAQNANGSGPQLHGNRGEEQTGTAAP